MVQRIVNDETETETSAAEIKLSQENYKIHSHEIELQVEIYPNPTTGIINIHVQTLNYEEPLQLRVLDVFGKEIIHQQLNNSINQQIDLSPYGKGFYLIPDLSLENLFSNTSV